MARVSTDGGFACLYHEAGESPELHDRLETWFFAGRVGDMPTQADIDRANWEADEEAERRREQYNEIRLEMEGVYAEPDYREGERQLQERKDQCSADGGDVAFNQYINWRRLGEPE